MTRSSEFSSRKPIKAQRSAKEQVTVTVIFIEGNHRRYVFKYFGDCHQTKKEQLLGKCFSIHNGVIFGQILPTQHFNLTTAEGLTSRMKILLPLIITSCGL